MSVLLSLALCEVFLKVSLCLSALVSLILLRVHSIFEEFLVVFSKIPSLFFHLLAIYIEVVGIVFLRVIGLELTSFRLCHIHEHLVHRSCEFARLAENHVPYIVGYERPALLSFLHLHDIHQCEVLDILGERCHEARVTHLGPDVRHFVEELDEELVGGQFGLIVFHLPFVQRPEVVLKVSHERSHHASGQSRLDEERVVEVVLRGDIVAEEVVHHLLNLCTHLHVSLHIDVLDLESCILEHLLHCDDVSVSGAP